jgi:3-dehydroquinate dehydratase type I
MKQVRDRAGSLGDIAKIVTMARTGEDNLRVLRLYEEDPRNLIAFCMGEAGMVSRLVSLQMGAPIIYASLPNEPVAPGQLSVTAVTRLKKMWEAGR